MTQSTSPLLGTSPRLRKGPRFGAHMSIAGEPANALRAGHRIGCDTIQMFTRSPNRWAGPPLTDEQVETFRSVRAETGIDPVIAHSAYLINLASPDDVLWERSRVLATEELSRAVRLGLDGYILHPGAHTGSGELPGLERIATGLRALLADPATGTVPILLETTSGAGTASAAGWSIWPGCGSTSPEAAVWASALTPRTCMVRGILSPAVPTIVRFGPSSTP